MESYCCGVAFALVYHFIALVPVATIGVIAAVQQGVGLATFRGGTQVPSAGQVPITPAPLAKPAPVTRDER